MSAASQPKKAAQRQPAEVVFRDELKKLAAMDLGPVPPGWQLSPRAVEKFVLGDDSLGIERKFVADRAMVVRIIISLCTSRGCLLVGEPGTAKSWLSELLTAAISGNSTLALQGGAITQVRQLLYGWNEAVLAAKGPCLEALVPSPLMRGMIEGRLVRFEEIARCPQALQDALLSVLSDRVLVVPEISGDDGVILAREGFNLVATSNSLDAGVHQMSAALKRRMDFEEIRPIKSLSDEIGVVLREVRRANDRAGISVDLDAEIIEFLVTMFHELRNGQTMDGRSTDRLAGAALSTAEAVSVAHAASLNAWYYGGGSMTVEQLMHHIIGSALKDHPDDRRRLKHYFETAIAQREGEVWAQVWALRSLIH
ncbi:AAA family ATPase [Marinobacter sp. 1_MG-2023]|uniref:ATP-binding protein n=1 Tax=Marinobacter sp. 1_MG-2023 TaxID=3062627 RepID=UPI0026E1AFC8|nr:AAA family ATPase [Marinobacter sp. 1_MG-2023]MDO6823615.1 AAA family ATPase [Marinobacter sp. 1_MG-2023]